MWARRFATGLSLLRNRAATRLAGSRFNPSRVDVADAAFWIYVVALIGFDSWLVFFSGAL